MAAAAMTTSPTLDAGLGLLPETSARTIEDIAKDGLGSNMNDAAETQNSLEAIDRILAMLGDPEATPEDINKEVALETFRVQRMLVEMSGRTTESDKQKFRQIRERAKNLKDAQKLVSDMAAQSRRDVLDFESPKFQYFFDEFMKLIKQAGQEAGIDQITMKTMWKNLTDLVAKNQERIEREAARIKPSSVTA